MARPTGLTAHLGPGAKENIVCTGFLGQHYQRGLGCVRFWLYEDPDRLLLSCVVLRPADARDGTDVREVRVSAPIAYVAGGDSEVFEYPHPRNALPVCIWLRPMDDGATVQAHARPAFGA